MYIMYLRKSQVDRGLEDTSATLDRHRQVLTEYAESHELRISEILEEVVSGESLSARPQMQRALELISSGAYRGILCMDIDRLSRGSSVDSGYIMQVLQAAGAKIVTPGKTYDLSADADEQFADMKFLFSRFELKTITKRLIRGRNQSAAEGKYLGSVPPYGYEITKIEGAKGNTLTIVQDRAQVVRRIFALYIDGRGYEDITYDLNDRAVPSPTGGKWHKSSVVRIITNITYTGQIRWGESKQIKQVIDGKLVKKRVTSTPQVYPGMHEAIVSEDVYRKAEAIRARRDHASVKRGHTVQNPFGGIMYCGECGSVIKRNTSNHSSPWYRCSNSRCTCRTTKCDIIESQILSSMRKWLDGYSISIAPTEPIPEATGLDPTALIAKLDKVCECFENGLYDAATFVRRRDAIQAQLDRIKSAKHEPTVDIIPTVQGLLDSYEDMTAADKNKIWASVLVKVTYYRPPGTNTEPVIEVFPRLPSLSCTV